MKAADAKAITLKALECEEIMGQVYDVIKYRAALGYSYIDLHNVKGISLFSEDVKSGVSKVLVDNGFKVSGRPGDVLWSALW